MNSASDVVDDDAIAKINDDVAVGEDLGFQRSWWKFEQAIWWFFLVIIACDLAGLFGRGPIANAHIASLDHEIDVKYERIQRTGTPSLLTVALADSAIREGKALLFVSESLVNELGTERVIPQPQSSVVGKAGITYTFPADGAATLRFELRPPSAGVYSLRIATRDGAAVETRIWVMP